MTDKEIITALECCLEDIANCDNCPYEHYCSIHQNNMLKDTLSLINHQKAEIERLNNRIVDVNKTIKAEAIKEFLAKVKNYIKTHCNPYGKPDFDYDTSIKVLNFIDNLAKEMVGKE